jgi:hypothetical protein
MCGVTPALQRDDGEILEHATRVVRENTLKREKCADCAVFRRCRVGVGRCISNSI